MLFYGYTFKTLGQFFNNIRFTRVVGLVGALRILLFKMKYKLSGEGFGSIESRPSLLWPSIEFGVPLSAQLNNSLQDLTFSRRVPCPKTEWSKSYDYLERIKPMDPRRLLFLLVLNRRTQLVLSHIIPLPCIKLRRRNGPYLSSSHTDRKTEKSPEGFPDYRQGGLNLWISFGCINFNNYRWFLFPLYPPNYDIWVS